MKHELLRSLIFLHLLTTVLRLAQPAPAPWESRRAPALEGRGGPLPRPSVPVRVHSPLQRPPGGHVPPGGAAPVAPAGQTAGARPGRRRHRRSNYRGSRGGVRWKRDQPDDVFIGQLNCQSLKHKLPEIRHDLSEIYHFDLLALSETWLAPSIPNRLLTINGYSLHRADRPVSSGLANGHGGVAILVRVLLCHGASDAGHYQHKQVQHRSCMGQ